MPTGFLVLEVLVVDGVSVVICTGVVVRVTRREIAKAIWFSTFGNRPFITRLTVTTYSENRPLVELSPLEYTGKFSSMGTRFKVTMQLFSQLSHAGGTTTSEATHLHPIREIPNSAKYEVRTSNGVWDEKEGNKWRPHKINDPHTVKDVDIPSPPSCALPVDDSNCSSSSLYTLVSQDESNIINVKALSEKLTAEGLIDQTRSSP
ncbi:hypothetical protein L218DRAFT_945989 [Marasmius fiardii PR-910]|nr:hypothetical protein L218DRAFT_945989 [Marasmius fiardii PR-910]